MEEGVEGIGRKIGVLTDLASDAFAPPPSPAGVFGALPPAGPSSPPPRATGVFGAVPLVFAGVTPPAPNAPGVTAPNPAGVLGAGVAPPNLSGVLKPAAGVPATGVARLPSKVWCLIAAGVLGAVFAFAGVMGMPDETAGVKGMAPGVCGTTKSFGKSPVTSFCMPNAWLCCGGIL